MRQKLEDLADVVMDWALPVMGLIFVPFILVMSVLLVWMAFAVFMESSLDRGFCLHERETRVTRLVGKTMVPDTELRCVEWEFPEGRP